MKTTPVEIAATYFSNIFFLKTGFHYIALVGLSGTQYTVKTGFKLKRSRCSASQMLRVRLMPPLTQNSLFPSLKRLFGIFSLTLSSLLHIK